MRHLFILTITCIFSRVHYLMIKWGFPVCVFHSKLCDTKQPNNVQQSKDAAPRRVLFVFRVDGTSAVCIHLNRTSAFGYVRVWLMDFLSSTDHLWWPPCLQSGHHHLKTEYVCAIRPKFDKITVVRMPYMWSGLRIRFNDYYTSLVCCFVCWYDFSYSRKECLLFMSELAWKCVYLCTNVSISTLVSSNSPGTRTCTET